MLKLTLAFALLVGVVSCIPMHNQMIYDQSLLNGNVSLLDVPIEVVTNSSEKIIIDDSQAPDVKQLGLEFEVATNGSLMSSNDARKVNFSQIKRNGNQKKYTVASQFDPAVKDVIGTIPEKVVEQVSDVNDITVGTIPDETKKILVLSSTTNSKDASISATPVKELIVQDINGSNHSILVTAKSGASGPLSGVWWSFSTIAISGLCLSYYII